MIKYLVLLSALNFFWFLSCAPAPLENDQSFPIRLSLEKIGIREAEFSGEPILAIIETPEEMMFSTLNWETGNGDFQFFDSVVSGKFRKFYAELSWRKYPIGKDSVDGEYYDTIYIGTGGNNYRSNPVRVKVTNLPVVIDSLMASVRTFRMSEPLWTFSVPDSIEKLHIKMFARDLDGRIPDLSVIGNTYGVEKNSLFPLQLVYQCPRGPFKDELTFIVYDHSRGQAVKTLNLNRSYPNVPPVIDSILIDGQKKALTSGVVQIDLPFIDTLRIRAFYHDTYDTIKKVRWKSSKNVIKTDSLHPESILYLCTLSTCTDTLLKGSKVIDTIWLQLFDSKNDSSKAAIQIVKTFFNRPPIIEEIGVNGESKLGDTTVIPVIRGNALTSYKLNVSASDLDSNLTQSKWSSKYGSFDVNTGDSVVYTSPATLAVDTVTVTVSDVEYSIDRKIVFIVDDLIPVFDSLIINNKKFENPDSVINYDARIGEQLSITAWVRDKDVKDTVKYSWVMSDPSKIISMQENKLNVQLLLKTYDDTISLNVQDGIYKKDYSLLIKSAVQEPVIDSITIRSKSYSSAVSSIIDSAVFPDTIPLKVYAHDIQKDTMSYIMTTIVRNRLTMIDSVTYKYITVDASYVDTIKIGVTDSKGNQALKSVVLKVN